MPRPLISPDQSQKVDLNERIPIPAQGITSKTLLEANGTKVVLFAMDREQEISPHRAPFPATVYVWEGRIRFKVEGKDYDMGPGELLLMKKDAVHELHALEPSRFVLTLLKQEAPQELKFSERK